MDEPLLNKARPEEAPRACERGRATLACALAFVFGIVLAGCTLHARERSLRLNVAMHDFLSPSPVLLSDDVAAVVRCSSNVLEGLEAAGRFKRVYPHGVVTFDCVSSDALQKAAEAAQRVVVIDARTWVLRAIPEFEEDAVVPVRGALRGTVHEVPAGSVLSSEWVLREGRRAANVGSAPWIARFEGRIPAGTAVLTF